VLRLDLPIYLAIGPGEEVLLQIPIEAVSQDGHSQTLVRQFRRQQDEEQDVSEKDLLSGTRFIVTEAGGRVTHFDSLELLLPAVSHLFKNIDYELKARLKRL
jgi:hypothetical protein